MSEDGNYSVLIALLIALCLLIAFVLEAHQPITREEACAKRLGVHWSVDDGVTEKMDEFAMCVRGRD